jgi:uncharacterized coiled-coil protein SlyX
MKEQTAAQRAIDDLERHVTYQDSEIQRLQRQIRAALAALQTGAALDVVAAIEILRRGL